LPALILIGLALLAWGARRWAAGRLGALADDIKRLEGLLSAGGVVRCKDRADWYHRMAAAIRNAPDGAIVRDSTTGPARLIEIPVDVDLARKDFIAALASRPHLSYRELYSSNFAQDVSATISAPVPPHNPQNLRVIPCAAPKFLFTDFIVVGADRVFLSGLGFGEEIDLDIKDVNLGSFFSLYFDMIFQQALAARPDQGKTLVESPTRQLVVLTPVLDCKAAGVAP
jgi:hypothetical protein